MTATILMFAVGDWIVHRHYGIGQITKREKRTISGNTAEYLKVKTPDSTIWLPITKLDESWFRPLASPEEFEEAVIIFKRPANQMNSNFMTRKERIQQVQNENSIPAIARLIRDLCYRQEQKALSLTEQRALRRLKERFVMEWSVALDLEEEAARQQLQSLLEDSYQQMPH